MSRRQKIDSDVQKKPLDAESFRVLHLKYYDRLLGSMAGLVRDRAKAEDITATAFLNAFKNRERFRGDSSPYTWLYAIAKNEAKDRNRRITVSLDASDAPVPEQLVDCDSASAGMERAARTEELQKALSQVPVIHGRALALHLVHGWSIRQIARHEGIPFGTVLSRISQGKRALRRAWAKLT